jgi:hypothetical protein
LWCWPRFLPVSCSFNCGAGQGFCLSAALLVCGAGQGSCSFSFLKVDNVLEPGFGAPGTAMA